MLTRSAIQTTVEVSDSAKISVTGYNADGGDGQLPILMINGWSDNRGIGDSSVAEGLYSVGGMAKDTVEVVASLGTAKCTCSASLLVGWWHSRWLPTLQIQWLRWCCAAQSRAAS
jgi:pimeloyl-ACP methyl ester carboxylesterase